MAHVWFEPPSRNLGDGTCGDHRHDFTGLETPAQLQIAFVVRAGHVVDDFAGLTYDHLVDRTVLLQGTMC